MWKIALLLVLTLIVVPIVTYRFDVPLTELQTTALWSVGMIYLVSALLCYVVSTITKNYSQVDKLWSINPVIYAWVVCYYSAWEDRIVLMAILVTIWGIRLTYNFSRRNGYSWKFWEGEEDYRWAILQARPEFQAAWKWSIFNLLFISLYQMGLILLFTLPILKSMNGVPLEITDYVLAAIFLGFVLYETIADQQQWTFQNEKHRLIAAGTPLPDKYKKGFVGEGLWALSRHPNYAAEQAIWIVFYLFSVVATGVWINWTIAGCLLLLILFKSSSDFSEGISEGKYPEYKDYQKKVGRFLPKIFPNSSNKERQEALD
ncbi:DUF1295 domain-containing protein [Saprospiraceae bacterium]|nr:DUF1295 domain-containing protein [Saprospiraceae bacterium]